MAFEPARTAFMGLGRWANVLADAALRGGKIRLVSCFSRTPEKRKKFMARFDTKEARTFEDLLRDEEVEAAAAHGIRLAVGHSARRLTVSRKLKALIEGGDLGEVSINESNFYTERGLELTPEKWRSDPRLNPTGVAIQLSIHHIDTFRYLRGPMKRVTAVLRHIHATAEVEDAAMIILEHENGVLSYVGGGWSCPWAFHMNVHGTKGVANFRITGQQWRDPSKAPEPIRLRIDREPLEEDKVLDMPEGDMFKDALEDFADCIREGRPPEVDGQAAFEDLAVVFAAAESSRLGKTVELKDFF